MANLTPKMRAFIYEYAQCGNGAEAARRAGYSVKSAKVTAARLIALPVIQKELANLAMNFQEKTRKRAVNTAHSVVSKLLDHVVNRLELPPDGDMTWRDSVAAGKLAAEIAKLTTRDNVQMAAGLNIQINLHGRSAPPPIDVTPTGHAQGEDEGF